MIKACDLRDLVTGLRAAGIRPGQDLLVHSSLRQVGPVRGGAADVLEALRIATEGATIVVPTHTAANSLSSRAFLAATAGMSTAQRARYVAAMPGFDPERTPSHGMGVLAEYVRTVAGAKRSSHPQTSFAAFGPRAERCTTGHQLDCHLGESSPLGWLYQAGGAVLLLGVGYAACTALHLAEYRLPRRRSRGYRCFIATGGTRQRREFTDADLIDSDFEAVGRLVDQEPFVRHGQVGGASCRLFPMRDIVDFAVTCGAFCRYRAGEFQTNCATLPGRADHE
jgi:aminoglycoside 3-N-acetyltransferase